MSWFRNIFRGGKESENEFRSIQRKFANFLALLENNNRVLKIMAELEEKARDEHPFDSACIRSGLAELRAGVGEIIENMIALGGDEYEALRDRYREIDAEIDKLVPGSCAGSVGGKSAQLRGWHKPRGGGPVPAHDAGASRLVEDLLARVSPLKLAHPAAPDFRLERCQTFHDLARFCRQKAMEEISGNASEIKGKHRIGLRLSSDIPLPVNLIYIDQELSSFTRASTVSEDAIASAPMQAFWDGLRRQGWPTRTPPADVGGFMAVMATSMAAGAGFSERSFAVLSREYMMLSLRMGYHFTAIEAMASDEPRSNYVHMQFKQGGASLERRLRRIKLISEILRLQGFENRSQGDFLESMFSGEGRDKILETLYLLGRLTIMTKQLDMALSSDAVANWYTSDIARKLGLRKADDG